jgi:hypothetical protein
MAIETAPTRSRRTLLMGLAGGLAAAAAGTLGRPQPASAHPRHVHLGVANKARVVTSITNTATNGGAFGGGASGTGTGVYGSSPWGVGVYGASQYDTGVGVWGSNPDLGVGVSGTSERGYGVSGQCGQGRGVYGSGETGVYGTSDIGTGVFGTSDSGHGIIGDCHSATNPGIVGRSTAGNTGVQGYSGPNGLPDGTAKTGVHGHADADLDSVGVRGTSPAGRGGVFEGGSAQLRLLPSTVTTHPASGRTGDLVVDSSGRLWYCRGASNWTQLA